MMRIERVEALHVRAEVIDPTVGDGTQDGLLVRVHTDTGIVGIGEVDSSPTVAKAIIEAPASHSVAAGLASLIEGENPLEVPRLWERMFRGSLYFGRRGAALHAISGIEIALWDIAGKARGESVASLLGGAKRSRVPAYASKLMPERPELVAAVVDETIEAGFGAVKLGWGGLGSSADLDVALIQEARRSAGEEVELMVDIGKRWGSVRDAIDRVHRLEEFRPAWIEEPFMPDEYAKYAALAAAVRVPLAAGEEETTIWDFERLAEHGGVEVLQPDVTRAGGIGECLKIDELAKRSGKRLVPHAFSTGVIKAATLQLLAVIDDAEWFEYCAQDGPLSEHLVTDQFPLTDGCVEIPTGPGLGIEIDEEWLQRCLVRDGG